MTTTITNKPATMSVKSSPRKNKHQFSTEYSDLSSDGLNSDLKEYTVLFNDTKTNIESLDAILESLNTTTAFLWNPFNGVVLGSVALPFICEEWEVNYKDIEHSTLSATFKQTTDYLIP